MHGSLTVAPGQWTDEADAFKQSLHDAHCEECTIEVLQVPSRGVGPLQKVATLFYKASDQPIPRAAPARPPEPPPVVEPPPAPEPVVAHEPEPAPTPAPVPTEPVAERQNQKNHHGMTWGVVRDAQSGYAHVGCAGTPKLAYSSRGGDCDPYAGDTSCMESRPLLCVRAGATPPSSLPEGRSDASWSGESVALSPSVPGLAMTSLEEANHICAKALGAGWKLAEFHDGGGWGFVGQGTVAGGGRFWVHINDQHGNCWNSN
jgi:hypothetical protein